VDIGNLTLTGTSSINFGATATGAAIFSFNQLNGNNTYALSIYNYSIDSAILTQIIDYSNNGSDYVNYSNIFFYSGATTSSTFLGMGQSFAGSNEIVPVPEPAVILSALLLLGTLIYTQRALITRYLSKAMGLCFSVLFVWK